MQLKITRSGPRTYLQIVQAYRDPETGRPKQRHIASLGRLDQLAEKDLDSLINGLLKVTNRPTLGELTRGISSETTTFEPALQLGDVWAIMQIWQQLKLAQNIARKAGRRRHSIDVEKLVRVMVINRLSDPRSKLGLLRWLEQVYLPGIDRAEITHQNLLRAMDALLEQKDRIEQDLVGTLLPLFDTEMEVVFYDITTVRVHGEHEEDGDLRQFGKSKDVDGIERQYAVGVVQTADGFPVTHEVFEGNISETTTVKGIVRKLCERFPITRLIFVADRAMLSIGNLEELEGISLSGGRNVEYILAVPARKYRKMTADLHEIHVRLLEESRKTGKEAVHEVDLEGGRRLVVAHSPEIARRSRRMRARRMVKALRVSRELAERLNGQEEGRRSRGRRLSDSGAKITFSTVLAKEKLTRLIKIDVEDDIFTWYWDVEELKRDLELDGKLILLTNVTDLSATELVRQYKDLADIERGFRVLKSQIEIAPVHHRLPDRIRAHTFICFLALVIQRVMRYRIKANGYPLSPEELLYRLRAVQHHRVRLSTGKQLAGVTTIRPEQQELFDAIGVEKPTGRRIQNAA